MMLDISVSDKSKITNTLLNWYKIYGRELPWRLHPRSRPPGMRPDPYAVWLSEVMLQQTTVATISKRYHAFVARWPTIVDLAAADDSDVMAAWAGMGYYARARNLLKCAREIVSKYEGRFPVRAKLLEQLPGIGPYTAAAIIAIAFDQPSSAVDANVERVLSRLFAVKEPLPKAKSLIRQYAAEICPDQQAGDWLQALMDLGALVCRPTDPNCSNCPIATYCNAKKLGLATKFPVKNQIRSSKLRRGCLYIGQRYDGALLLEQRPPEGIMGGMLGWPSGGWENNPDNFPPCDGDWQVVGEVSHALTHMKLQLEVYCASLPMTINPIKGHFIPRHSFREEDLPTLMRKAYNIAKNEMKIAVSQKS